MKTRNAVVLSMLAGVAIGGYAVQALHAQTKAKLKAYSVGEVELTGTLPSDYLPAACKAIERPTVAPCAP